MSYHYVGYDRFGTFWRASYKGRICGTRPFGVSVKQDISLNLFLAVGVKGPVHIMAKKITPYSLMKSGGKVSGVGAPFFEKKDPIYDSVDLITNRLRTALSD